MSISLSVSSACERARVCVCEPGPGAFIIAILKCEIYRKISREEHLLPAPSTFHQTQNICIVVKQSLLVAHIAADACILAAKRLCARRCVYDRRVVFVYCIRFECRVALFLFFAFIIALLTFFLHIHPAPNETVSSLIAHVAIPCHWIVCICRAMFLFLLCVIKGTQYYCSIKNQHKILRRQQRWRWQRRRRRWCAARNHR